MATIHLTSKCALQGIITEARPSTRPVYTFRGIPYATPPIGKKRFLPPEPAHLWTGVRNAAQFGHICPQDLTETRLTYAPYQVPETLSDDCLYLNIFTPTTDQAAQLPVMVWIHGGSFVQGLSDYYNGTAICDQHDVIVVSINYRLGFLGFMSLGDNTAPGNIGLLDQVEALRWVHQHISSFGGNPHNVTLFGESAGAICISLHLISPFSAGLFHRAIMQSGACFYANAVWSGQQARKYVSNKVSKVAKVSNDSRSIMSVLNSMPSTSLVPALGVGFNPVLDGTFLRLTPEDAYKKTSVNNVPVIFNVNSHEGAQFVYSILRMKGLKKMLVPDIDMAREVLHLMVHVRFFRGHRSINKIEAVLDKYYLREWTSDVEKLTCRLVDMYGDLLFIVPSLIQADWHSEVAKTYVSTFTHRPCFSPFPDWMKGADHGQEIPFVFGEPFQTRFPDIWEENEKELSKTIMREWTHFARYGEPLTERWIKYSKASPNVYNLADNRNGTVSRPKDVAFWKTKLIPLIYSKPSANL